MSGITSRRYENLPKQALDLIAFGLRIMDGGIYHSVELKLDNPIRYLLEGGAIHWHGLGDSENYYTHRDDPEWAVLTREDCTGNPDDGRGYLESLE